MQVGEACICRLSHVLESLKDVRHMSLAGNHLSSLPMSVWQMQSLVTLDLSNNRLAELPYEASQLENLKVRSKLSLPQF